MRDNVRDGRFSVDHYVAMWSARVAQARGDGDADDGDGDDDDDEKRASDKARCVEQLKVDGDAAFFGGDAAIVSDDGTPPMSFQAFLAASAAKGQTHVVLVFGDGDAMDKFYDKFDEVFALADRVALVYVPWSLYSDECSHAPFLLSLIHI